jgi:hypothetical protein
VSGKVDSAHASLAQKVFKAVFVVEYVANVMFESGHEAPMLSHYPPQMKLSLCAGSVSVVVFPSK